MKNLCTLTVFYVNRDNGDVHHSDYQFIGLKGLHAALECVERIKADNERIAMFRVFRTIIWD